VKINLTGRKAWNFLDMVPVRNVSEFTREGDRITLHVPKFRSPGLRRLLIPPRRSAYFRIHLDETGSMVWELIDGIRDTSEICNRINEQMPEGKSKENLEQRVTEYLRQLYKHRFILFKPQ